VVQIAPLLELLVDPLELELVLLVELELLLPLDDELLPTEVVVLAPLLVELPELVLLVLDPLDVLAAAELVVVGLPVVPPLLLAYTQVPPLTNVPPSQPERKKLLSSGSQPASSSANRTAAPLTMSESGLPRSVLRGRLRRSPLARPTCSSARRRGPQSPGSG